LFEILEDAAPQAVMGNVAEEGRCYSLGSSSVVEWLCCVC
jgi:hypothetical protein